MAASHRRDDSDDHRWWRAARRAERDSRIKGDWWLAPTTLATDDAGRIRFTGFLGEYEVSVGDRSTTFNPDRSGVLGLSVAV